MGKNIYLGSMLAAATFGLTGCGNENTPTINGQRPAISQSIEDRIKSSIQSDLTDSEILDKYRIGAHNFTPVQGERLSSILYEQLDKSKLSKNTPVLYAKSDSVKTVFYDPDLKVPAQNFVLERSGSIRGTGIYTVNPTFILNPEIYDRGNGKKSISFEAGWMDADLFVQHANDYARRIIKSDIQMLAGLIDAIKTSSEPLHVEELIREKPEHVIKRLGELELRGYLDQEPTLEDFKIKLRELQQAERLTLQIPRRVI